MALTDLQKEIMASIAKNRSETSYVAGGLVLNMNWPRLSDDIDIFQDTDEEIGPTADRDIETLKGDGFRVYIEVNVYGCVEAEVSKAHENTLIQWMSESRTRFFPLIRDEEWGARLHPADLAVNKVLAASTRTKPRDFVDLVMIDERMSPLGAVIMAASGKPPHYSPIRIIDEIRRRGLSVSTDEYDSVRGLPMDFTANVVREKLVEALDRAESYIRSAPADIVGLLAVNSGGMPVRILALNEAGVQFRKATSEPDLMPSLPNVPEEWMSDR
ncbi:nucleotidyl transferase AbiEii/AbiGii toxin family protein [Agrobacterium rhizogenes]|uniref:nucleotidyl transferase AbiEii/AbiGii toxin family protein n=1 Tax=Rhizobium rhizogenes TaxID=359 RepID=UPI00157327E9|nr:nucleotidyl transferase AbiEii/AbiGii toxin family protein [Rhizobium rhizogenes]NTG46958.1 nucleotidyl transferase AbiEii/AbiGii toxin family protein [Rhizobium rhizogenes]